MFKQVGQRFIKILLIWSIAIFIFLLILEDLKPYLVKVHFTPHWLVPIILGLFVWQMFSQDSYQPKPPNLKYLKFFSYLIIFISLLLTFKLLSYNFWFAWVGLFFGFFVLRIFYKHLK